jgi:hypothetical protein
MGRLLWAAAEGGLTWGLQRRVEGGAEVGDDLRCPSHEPPGCRP